MSEQKKGRPGQTRPRRAGKIGDYASPEALERFRASLPDKEPRSIPASELFGTDGPFVSITFPRRTRADEDPED